MTTLKNILMSQKLRGLLTDSLKWLGHSMQLQGDGDELEDLNEGLIADAPAPPPEKKWYTRDCAIAIYLVVAALALIGFAMGMCAVFLEYGQCERSCRLEFCDSPNDSVCLLDSGISGRRKSPADRSKCVCRAPHLFRGEIVIDRMQKPTDTWAVDEQEQRWCSIPRNSTDGKGITYPDRNASRDDGADELHLGPCGMCSSESDRRAYNRTAMTLTGIATGAAFASIFSTRFARTIMLNTGLSPGCIDCWIGNMHQTLVHCFGTCISSSRRGCDSNGELTKCLYCDEVHSGMYFRRCAGMTRRRAGIETDICRRPGEIVT